MKTLVALVVVLAVLHCAHARRMQAPKSLDIPRVWKTFVNRVDHFDAQNTKTYHQRYWLSESKASNAAGPNAPVFFFLGGEAALEFFDFQEVSALKWAEENGAHYIALEHRYYGESNPTSDFSTPNMRYLSSEQALADAAAFVQHLQETSFHGPWVVFGCSYSGGLSAWFRMKFPHLVVGAVAPSGPVKPEAKFVGYLANFGHVAPSGCVAATKTAVKNIQAMYLTADGRSKLGSYFNSCKPLAQDEDFMFKWSISEFLASSAQWQNPPANVLTQACDILTANQDPVKGWANAFLQMGASTPPACTDFSNKAYYDPLLDTSTGNDGRAWYYQTCAEFGYFQVGYPGTSVFFGDMTLDQVNGCAKVFGIPGMYPNTAWTTANYGALKLAGSHILFTNGRYDPWHTISITKNEGDVQSVLYEAAHCAPMTAPTSSDPPSLTAARTAVSNFLKNLLHNA